MSNTFQVVRLKETSLEFEGGGDVGQILARCVDETKSDKIGAGYFRVNGVENRLDLPYDEVATCLEGTLKLTVDGVLHELKAGDFAFIPKGTDVTFAGDNCVCAYSVYPVNWRTAG